MILVINFIIFSFFYLFFNKISEYLNFFDHPNIKKIHSQKIAPIGGLIIMATVTSNLVFLNINSDFNNFIMISLFIILIGLLDDKYNINPYARLLYQVFWSSVLVIFFLRVETLGNYPFFGNLSLNIYLLNIFSILCIVGLTNAINFIDGIDGLASGLVLVALLQIILFYYGFNLLNIELFLVLFMFVLTIFFIINLFDKILFFKKIFLGNSGSIYIGFFISIILIYYGNRSNNSYHQVMSLWVVSIPVYDFFATSIHRLINKKNPMQSDMLHIHHLLLKIGLGQLTITFSILLVALLLGLLGFSLLNFFNSLISLIMYFVIFIIYYNFKKIIIYKIK